MKEPSTDGEPNVPIKKRQPARKRQVQREFDSVRLPIPDLDAEEVTDVLGLGLGLGGGDVDIDMEEDETNLLRTNPAVEEEARMIASRYQEHLEYWKDPEIAKASASDTKKKPKGAGKRRKKNGDDEALYDADIKEQEALIVTDANNAQLPAQPKPARMMMCGRCRKPLDEFSRLNGGLHACPNTSYLHLNGKKKLKKKNYELPLQVTYEKPDMAPTFQCPLCVEWHSVLDICPIDRVVVDI